jgi:hypothetical protein
MTASAFFTTENKKNSPILIIDKEGIIGSKLAEKIKNELTVVFVSSFKPDLTDNIIHVIFGKNFPQLPDNTYSHIIVVDEQYALSKKIVDSLIKKSRKDKAIAFFAVNKDYITERFFAEYVLRNENVKLGILGDIFANDEVFKNGNDVNIILTGIKKYGIINIPGNGTSESYPVLLDDAVNAIAESCFSQVKEKTIYIMPKNPITFLSLALLFKKIFPEIRLDFMKEEKIVKTKKLLLQGKYILGDKYDLTEKVKKINIEKIEGYEKTKVTTPSNVKYSIFLTTIFLLSLILLPLLTTFVCFWTGRALINHTNQLLSNGNYIGAEMSANVSRQVLFISSISIGMLNQELKIINKEKLTNKFTGQVNNYYLSSDLNVNLLNAINKLNSNVQDFNNIAYPFNIAIKEAGILTINDKNLISKDIINLVNYYGVYKNYLPDLLGFIKQKTYLLILADDAYAGTSSGAINSYSIIKAKNGKIEIGILVKLSTPSADFKNINLQTNIDGIITIDNTFLTRFVNNFNNQNSITIKLLIFLENSLKDKHLTFLFSNQYLNQTISIINK